MAHRHLFKNRAICASAAMIVMFVISGAAHGGGVLYVDDDAQPGGDGTSWNGAYRFLQDALTDADGGGITEIRVGQGAYQPDRDDANPDGTGDREATFQLCNGVVLMGGYAGFGAEDPDARDIELYETILSGEIGDPEDPNDNIAHVLTATNVNSRTILDGVSVTRGSAYINELPLEQAVGGGLYIINGDPVIRAVSFHDNRAPAGQSFAGGRGAGVYVDGGSPVFENCDFVNNSAEEGGAGLSSVGNPTLISCTFMNNMNEANNSPNGGAFQTEAGTAVLVDCHFVENTTDSTGGGLRSAETDLVLVRCSFVNNSSGGSGSAGADVRYGSAVIVGCEFIGNITGSGGAGGGLFLESPSGLVMNCLFQENSSPEGGAILTQANVFITNCYFDSNVGTEGGALQTSGWAVEVANSVFFNNFGVDGGGAIYARSEPLTLTNCVVANNSSPGVGDGIWVRTGDVISTNCILWGNGGAGESSQIFLDEFGSATVNYTVIQGLTGNLGGVGNLGDDPMFVDQDGGDFRLMPGSPCIDAGNNWGVPVDEFDFDEDGLLCELFPVDLDGNPRFNADEVDFDPGCGVPVVVDMGAYEYQFDSADQVTFADLNGDDVVGAADLLGLLVSWGTCGKGCCLADLDIDGTVGASDLLALLVNWGPCP